MRANKDAFMRACSSSSYENKDEDLKVIDVSLKVQLSLGGFGNS